MFDTVERCQSCGAKTLRWYLRVGATVALIVVTIALLAYMIHSISQPQFEKLPQPE